MNIRELWKDKETPASYARWMAIDAFIVLLGFAGALFYLGHGREVLGLLCVGVAVFFSLLVVEGWFRRRELRRKPER